jgi:formylglycine-generating enzyme
MFLAIVAGATFLVASCSYPELPRLPVQDAGPDAMGEDRPPPLGESQSCNSLPSNCGEFSNESCCSTLLVNGGTFFRGYDTANDPGSGNRASPATISPFLLDKFEVTASRFAQFIGMDERGTQGSPPLHRAGEHPGLKGSGWNREWNTFLASNTPSLQVLLSRCNEYSTRFREATVPINCVSWYEAMAFCIWDGGYLPTEAERNFAASGPTHLVYPWGNYSDWTPSVSSNDCLGDFQPGCTPSDIYPVGVKLGLGPWGHEDLGGNVSEWVLDWFGFGEYPVPCSDCAQLIQPSGPPFRAVQGGAFDVFNPRITESRYGSAPYARGGDLGFRCARPAP